MDNRQQCEGKEAKSLGTRRCPKKAKHGSRWCDTCGKRRHISTVRQNTGGERIGGGRKKPIGSLPVAYRRVLSQSLRSAIEAEMNESPAEQLSLLEELALVRHSTQRAVLLYDAAYGLPDNNDERSQLLDTAGTLMRSALSEVAAMCRQAAQVDSLAKDKLSLAQVGVIIDQIVRCAYEVFGAPPVDANGTVYEPVPNELIEQFALAVRERVRLPTVNAAHGTSITPDQDVTDMDATIPGE